MATNEGAALVSVYRSPRTGRTPKAISNKDFRPHCRALMLDHEANSVTTTCVVITQTDMNILEDRPWPLKSIIFLSDDVLIDKPIAATALIHDLTVMTRH